MAFMPLPIPIIIPHSGAVTAGSLAYSAAFGIAVGSAAALGVMAAYNPKFRSAVNFGLAATLFAPILAAEDLLRWNGFNVPTKGMMYNDEGKSISQIWSESKPDVEIVESHNEPAKESLDAVRQLAESLNLKVS